MIQSPYILLETRHHSICSLQFVAMPLGEGYTVEEQLTGKAEIGGLQFDIFHRYNSIATFKKVVEGDEPLQLTNEEIFKTPAELKLTGKLSMVSS